MFVTFITRYAKRIDTARMRLTKAFLALICIPSSLAFVTTPRPWTCNPGHNKAKTPVLARTLSFIPNPNFAASEDKPLALHSRCKYLGSLKREEEERVFGLISRGHRARCVMVSHT